MRKKTTTIGKPYLTDTPDLGDLKHLRTLYQGNATYWHRTPLVINHLYSVCCNV